VRNIEKKLRKIRIGGGCKSQAVKDRDRVKGEKFSMEADRKKVGTKHRASSADV
jgi:hypothetical protein